MSTNVQVHLKRACMWTREHVYVIARVGAKNDLASVCLCIHPSIRLAIGMFVKRYVRMLLSAALSNVCPSVRPFVCPPACMSM